MIFFGSKVRVIPSGAYGLCMAVSEVPGSDIIGLRGWFCTVDSTILQVIHEAEVGFSQ
jgi:hypothetical protein